MTTIRADVRVRAAVVAGVLTEPPVSPHVAIRASLPVVTRARPILSTRYHDRFSRFGILSIFFGVEKSCARTCRGYIDSTCVARGSRACDRVWGIHMAHIESSGLAESGEHSEQPPEQKNAPVGYGWLRALLFFVAFLILTVIQSIVVVLITGFQSLDDFSAAMVTPTMVVIEAVQLLVVLGLLWLFCRFLDRRSVKSIGFSLERQYKWDLLAGLLWGVGLVTAIFLGLWLFGAVRVVSVQFPITTILIMAAVMISIGVREEIVMRGYMLNNLMQSANKYLSLLLIAMVFALAHGLNPNVSWIGLTNIIIAGLLLGIYYIHQKNLWFPIGLHIGWNYVQGVVWGSPVSGMDIPSVVTLEFVGPERWTGGDFGFEASLATTVITIIATILIHFRYRDGQRMAGIQRNSPEG
ncbi:CPBP family intramembrane metalloprotease [candidate division GN15 bacterium]|nr:CPBP family intramembrane metalloprotease [candidate division GN15 bacterium]